MLHEYDPGIEFDQMTITGGSGTAEACEFPRDWWQVPNVVSVDSIIGFDSSNPLHHLSIVETRVYVNTDTGQFRTVQFVPLASIEQLGLQVANK